MNVVRRKTGGSAPERAGRDDVESAAKDLETMTREMVSRLVDHPSDIEVFMTVGECTVSIEVRCRQSDVGAMLGQRGAHAQAMRTLLTAAGAAKGVRMLVHFLEN